MARIEDLQLLTFGEVLKKRLNNNDELVRDFVDTYGSNIRPLEEVHILSPGSMTVIFGGNSAYPALALWRATNEYYSFTNKERRNTATVGMKYVLPADRETQDAFAVLNRISKEIDKIQFYAQEYPLDGDLMAAAGIHSWGYRWNVHNGYEGPNEQTLYPTFNGTIELDMDDHFDRSKLANFVELYVKYNLRGPGSDGSEPPSIDALLEQSLPQPPPLYIPR